MYKCLLRPTWAWTEALKGSQNMEVSFVADGRPRCASETGSTTSAPASEHGVAGKSVRKGTATEHCTGTVVQCTQPGTGTVTSSADPRREVSCVGSALSGGRGRQAALQSGGTTAPPAAAPSPPALGPQPSRGRSVPHGGLDLRSLGDQWCSASLPVLAGRSCAFLAETSSLILCPL